MYTHKYVLMCEGNVVGDFFDVEKLMKKQSELKRTNKDLNFETQLYKLNKYGEWVYSGTTEIYLKSIERSESTS